MIEGQSSTFHKSTEYRAYLAKNQEKLNELNKKMMELQTTPEITALQKEIKELRKEIYGG